MRWLESAVTADGERHVVVDGKTLRRSFEGTGGRRALHVVSAFATGELSLVLGQVAVDDKSNEITAIPALLRPLDLKGAIVTIDAMVTHKETAAQITAQGGDYLLALKANHPILYEDAQRHFGDGPPWPSPAQPAPKPSRRTTGASKHASAAAWPPNDC